MNISVIKRNMAGFSLLEVLIAVVITAIGLLGVAKLHMSNLQNTNYAYQLSVATSLAVEMAERIRANRQGVINLDYNGPTAAVSSTCYSTGCTPQQMADTDYFEWTTKLASQLPGGTGTICIDSSGGTACNGDSVTNAVTYVIVVNWNDHGQARTTNLPVRILP